MTQIVLNKQKISLKIVPSDRHLSCIQLRLEGSHSGSKRCDRHGGWIKARSRQLQKKKGIVVVSSKQWDAMPPGKDQTRGHQGTPATTDDVFDVDEKPREVAIYEKTDQLTTDRQDPSPSKDFLLY